MSSSSFSYNTTFTITNAKYLASKVATDLKRIQRFYGAPTDQQISNYELELTELLKGGYLDNVTYGFRRNGNWIKPTIRYSSEDLANDSIDDDPGKIPAREDIGNSLFYSFLIYSSKWQQLTDEERESFNTKLPFQRGYANQPSAEGYFANDHIYASGGKSINRSSLK